MNAVTRQVLLQLALFGFFLLGSLVGNARVVTAENLGGWVAVSVLTGVASTLTIDIAWQVWTRRNAGRPLRVTSAVGVSALVGGVFSVTQIGLAQILGLGAERDPLTAAVSSIITITIVGVAVASFINGDRREKERRRRLLEEGIAVSMVREDVTDIVQRMQVALGTNIDDALAPARRGIEERLADQERALNQDEWASIATELRAAAQNTVRPLSRELWFRTAGQLAPVSVSEVLRNIITKQPFRPLPLALILIVTGFATSITLYGWGVGLVVVGLGVALVFIILGIANAAMDRWPAHHAVVFIGGALVLEAGTLINFPLRDWQQAQPYTWGEAIAAIIFGLVFILLTSGAGSLRTHRDDVARTFRSGIDRELIESMAASRQVAQLARESARILHGSVQTRLIACAVAIERASETRDVDAFQEALREAHDVLTEPARHEAPDEATLDDEVQRKVSLWSGLCAIDVDIAPSLRHIGGRTARDVGRVVEEGLSNAIRHGSATSIHVRIARSDSSVSVEIDDNGRGPQHGSPGLGSSLLDSVSPAWQLSARPVGARLRVELPLP